MLIPYKCILLPPCLKPGYGPAPSWNISSAFITCARQSTANLPQTRTELLKLQSSSGFQWKLNIFISIWRLETFANQSVNRTLRPRRFQAWIISSNVFVCDVEAHAPVWTVSFGFWWWCLLAMGDRLPSECHVIFSKIHVFAVSTFCCCTFQGLGALQWLYVRNNKIQTIATHAFLPLKRVRYGFPQHWNKTVFWKDFKNLPCSSKYEFLVNVRNVLGN